MAAKNSPRLLLDLINEANVHQFKDGDLGFGAPLAVTLHDRNTQVVITALKPTQIQGSVIGYYNRLDLALMFEKAGVSHITLALGDASSTLDLLDQVNKHFGLGLEVSDIQYAALQGPWPKDVTLTAHASSLGFIGSFEVRVEEGPVDLELIITHRILEGLHYPGPPSASGFTF